MIVFGELFLEETTEIEQWPDTFQFCSQFTESTWHYSLKFFVVKNHLRNRSLSNCSLLDSRFARSCSTRPSQRSKYTEGVARRMRRYIVVRISMLSRKCVQKKNTLGASPAVGQLETRKRGNGNGNGNGKGRPKRKSIFLTRLLTTSILE